MNLAIGVMGSSSGVADPELTARLDGRARNENAKHTETEAPSCLEFAPQFRVLRPIGGIAGELRTTPRCTGPVRVNGRWTTRAAPWRSTALAPLREVRVRPSSCSLDAAASTRLPDCVESRSALCSPVVPYIIISSAKRSELASASSWKPVKPARCITIVC